MKTFYSWESPVCLRDLGNWFFLILRVTFYLIPIETFHNSFLISSIKDGTFRKKMGTDGIYTSREGREILFLFLSTSNTQ